MITMVLSNTDTNDDDSNTDNETNHNNKMYS